MKSIWGQWQLFRTDVKIISIPCIDIGSYDSDLSEKRIFPVV